jgi:hypothetical protein
MADVFVYIVDLPDRVDEMVTPCIDGYTIYLNAKLTYSGRVKAYMHALEHVRRNDWSKECVQQIEMEGHDGTV